MRDDTRRTSRLPASFVLVIPFAYKYVVVPAILKRTKQKKIYIYTRRFVRYSTRIPRKSSLLFQCWNALKF